MCCTEVRSVRFSDSFLFTILDTKQKEIFELILNSDLDHNYSTLSKIEKDEYKKNLTASEIEYIFESISDKITQDCQDWEIDKKNEIIKKLKLEKKDVLSCEKIYRERRMIEQQEQRNKEICLNNIEKELSEKNDELTSVTNLNTNLLLEYHSFKNQLILGQRRQDYEGALKNLQVIDQALFGIFRNDPTYFWLPSVFDKNTWGDLDLSSILFLVHIRLTQDIPRRLMSKDLPDQEKNEIEIARHLIQSAYEALVDIQNQYIQKNNLLSASEILNTDQLILEKNTDPHIEMSGLNEDVKIGEIRNREKLEQEKPKLESGLGEMKGPDSTQKKKEAKRFIKTMKIKNQDAIINMLNNSAEGDVVEKILELNPDYANTSSLSKDLYKINNKEEIDKIFNAVSEQLPEEYRQQVLASKKNMHKHEEYMHFWDNEIQKKSDTLEKIKAQIAVIRNRNLKIGEPTDSVRKKLEILQATKELHLLKSRSNDWKEYVKILDNFSIIFGAISNISCDYPEDAANLFNELSLREWDKASFDSILSNIHRKFTYDIPVLIVREKDTMTESIKCNIETQKQKIENAYNTLIHIKKEYLEKNDFPSTSKEVDMIELYGRNRIVMLETVIHESPQILPFPKRELEENSKKQSLLLNDDVVLEGVFDFPQSLLKIDTIVNSILRAEEKEIAQQLFQELAKEYAHCITKEVYDVLFKDDEMNKQCFMKHYKKNDASAPKLIPEIALLFE